jgi:hypothetical protein
MFGSKILDVAIGLILIYLMLSLVASAVREAAEGFVKSRAVELERGIRSLLDDPEGRGLVRSLYEHPLIYSLYPNQFRPAKRRFSGGNLPTYIPARNFAVALLDLAARGPIGAYAAQQTAVDLSPDGLRASVQRIPSPFVRHAILTAIDTAHGDVARVQKNLEEWYDSAMDRVSGHYKRRTQLWLFVIGLGTTLALNVNTVTIADYLSKNEQVRAALVDRAGATARDSFYRRVAGDAVVDRATADAVYADLQALRLPIGWERQLPRPRPAPGEDRFWYDFWYYVKLGAGLLLTAFAIMLGAPFWFDLLNKFMVIRSTVKPKEKSPEESSEDRQKGKAGTGRATGADAAASGVDAGAAAGSDAATRRPPAPPGLPAPPPERPAAASPPSPYSHEWAQGEAQEGVL